MQILKKAKEYINKLKKLNSIILYHSQSFSIQQIENEPLFQVQMEHLQRKHIY